MLLAIGEGHGIEDERGQLVASSVVIPYAPGIGWIGMVLVDEAARRRGYATRLLVNAISIINQSGAVPMLDATPAGREVYLTLGFRDGAGIGRWRGAGRKPSTDGAVTEMTDEQAEAGIRADAAAFGANRRRLLENLRARQGSVALALPDSRGWLWSRAGRTATQIGPIVAARPSDAIALCSAALDRIDGPVLLDVPHRQGELTAFLETRGFARERSLTRMALANTSPNLDGSVHAIAGPEFG